MLDIDHVRDSLPEKVGPLTWKKWMQKKKRVYTCFSTPESLDYILRYLESHPPKDSGKMAIFRTYNEKPLVGGGGL